jgi:hypothetical protein
VFTCHFLFLIAQVSSGEFVTTRESASPVPNALGKSGSYFDSVTSGKDSRGPARAPSGISTPLGENRHTGIGLQVQPLRLYGVLYVCIVVDHTVAVNKQLAEIPNEVNFFVASQKFVFLRANRLLICMKEQKSTQFGNSTTE